MIGKLAGRQLSVQIEFRIGEQHSEFRSGKAFLRLATPVQLIVVWKEFDGAINEPAPLQIPYETHVGVEIASASCLGSGNGQGLIVIVAQDMDSDIVGHSVQELVTLPFGHFEWRVR